MGYMAANKVLHRDSYIECLFLHLFCVWQKANLKNSGTNLPVSLFNRCKTFDHYSLQSSNMCTLTKIRGWPCSHHGHLNKHTTR